MKRYVEWANKQYGDPVTTTTTTTNPNVRSTLPGFGPDVAICNFGLRDYNPATQEIVRLSRLESDMRLQQKYNCEKGSSFKACLYYNHYLSEVMPHSLDSFCKRDGACVNGFEAEKRTYSAYLEARIPAKVLEISKTLPLAFIDPILAEDENRAYQEIVKNSPSLEPLARREYQHRLCRPEKQKELGSDELECRKFVDLYIESQRARNLASVRP